MSALDAETQRLEEDARRERNWKRWGPYLSERQWGTVREDYSPDGECWDYFPHDHARSRVYRWGEDGLLGICDRECRLCFGLALWNGRDPFLKERLFGLTGPQGNHGEDVKECYYYLDSTPTHSYFAALYKYPQAEFPYADLVAESARRGADDPEYELTDTGVFAEERYFDVQAEYAKGGPNDLLIRITVTNRGPELARLELLPQLWFRNTWAWGREGEGYWPEPSLALASAAQVACDHASLGRFWLAFDPGPQGELPEPLFTCNETNQERLWGVPNQRTFVRDAFHRYVVEGARDAVDPDQRGTKVALRYALELPAGGAAVVRLRLSADEEAPDVAFGPAFEELFARRRAEADAFYARHIPSEATAPERQVARQAYAGLLWSKQFYYYVVREWLRGDPDQPPPPDERRHGRNAGWDLLHNRDVILMPDPWEYPWYACWDLAFHVVALAEIDPELAKQQLVLFLREWYMHPNGQLPAYEFALGDVNPPVHAWAVWRVYKVTGPRGGRDRAFLERAFHKLLLNFTWWVNRKDEEGDNLFGGGFLGLDNIGVFDRSRPLPGGLRLEQADGTAWMAFYCGTMLSIALELAREEPIYEDLASKFFEHYVAIVDAINELGEEGLWDEEDGFYYDQLRRGHAGHLRVRVRSMVGLIPLFAVEVLDGPLLEAMPHFGKRMRWFLEHKPELAEGCSYLLGCAADQRRLLAIPSRERLERVLRRLLDEDEFLSPHGVRSLSRAHRDDPFVLRWDGQAHEVRYTPGESTSGMFGGNSNWRGPVWFPVNYLLIEALERYDLYFGDELQVELPTGSGNRRRLGEVAQELSRRLVSLFLPGAAGARPSLAAEPRYAKDPAWRELLLFHEYFHGDTGAGLGACHQTGWTALVVRLIEDLARARRRSGSEVE
ncbi:MAG: glucosidase [Planctomycetota bacterium]